MKGEEAAITAYPAVHNIPVKHSTKTELAFTIKTIAFYALVSTDEQDGMAGAEHRVTRPVASLPLVVVVFSAGFVSILG
jgi:hypothetical protein